MKLKKYIQHEAYRIYLKIKERVFRGEKCNLKYLFFRKPNSKYLLIIFSAFGIDEARYNYLTHFSKLACNRLYILDNFGSNPQGSYYLGKDGDFFIEEQSYKLIKYISKKYGILDRDIICAGSSKGAYASIHFGFKYNFGHVVAGAPQIFLGDYLSQPKHTQILNYIFGGTGEKEIKQGNELLFNILESVENRPDIHIHIGDKDTHYKKDVLPLFEKFKSKNIKYYLDLQPGETHDDIGTYFPKFAKNEINKIIEM